MPPSSMKKKKQTDEVRLTEEQLVEIDNRIDALLKTKMPISKIKKIYRMDPSSMSMTGEAQRILAKATELFIEQMTRNMHTQAVLEKRKTLQAKDLDKLIKTNWMFAFLEDALDDWPEKETVPKNFRKQVTESIQEEAEQDENQEPEMESQENDEDAEMNETTEAGSLKDAEFDEAEPEPEQEQYEPPEPEQKNTEENTEESEEDLESDSGNSDLQDPEDPEDNDHGLWPPPSDD